MGTFEQDVIEAGTSITKGGVEVPGLISRGDVSDWDFSATDFDVEGTWTDLDLSSIVPAGASWVLLRGQARATSCNRQILFRKNGYSGTRNAAGPRTQMANVFINDYSIIVECDSSRVVEYRKDTATWSNLDFTVAGWWI